MTFAPRAFAHGISERFSRVGLGQEKEYFLENITAMLAAGVPVIPATRAVGAELKSKRMQKIVETFCTDVEAGASLSLALENTKIFSKHVSALVHIGEESGRLVENLRVLSAEQKKERVLRSKLRSAAMYPVFVLFLTAGIGVGVAWFILPKLSNVFLQMHIALPLITSILIHVGLFIGDYGAYAIPAGFLLLATLLYLVFVAERTKRMGEWILFHIPGVSKLLQEVELARFGYLLGTLLSAGLSPHQGLEALARATEYQRYQRLYLAMDEHIAEGYSYKKAMQSYPNVGALLPTPVQQLIIAAEQSTALPKTLLQIGEEYESRTDTSAKDLAVILEPLLLVLVWMGVVAVALAIIMPVYSLIGSLNT